MIEALKSKVIEAGGFPVNTRGDCELLSQLILELTDEVVNYNTLRRFFGLDKAVVPRRSTLDILSRFVGYADFREFCLLDKSFNEWDLTYLTLQTLSTGTIDDLIQRVRMDAISTPSLIRKLSIWRELILQQRFEDLLKILDSGAFDPSSFPYVQQLDFAYSVGTIMKDCEVNEIDALLNHPVFIEGIYLCLVDYGALNGYYGRWTALMQRQKRSPEVDVFVTCLSQWSAFLNGQKMLASEPSNLLFEGCHPLLFGRIYSCCLLARNMNEFESLWDEMKGQEFMKDENRPGLFHEMMTLALLVPHLPYSRWLLKTASISRDRLEPFEFHDFLSYRLLEAQVALFDRDVKLAQRKFDQIDPRDFLANYRPLIMFPYLRIKHELQREVRSYPQSVKKQFEHLGHEWIGQSLWLKYFNSPLLS